MSKHTPGPWSWSDDYQARDLSDTWSLLGKDGYGILSCDGKANSPQEVNPADARLIAAAPELLEALKTMLGEFNEHMAGVVHDELAAIAKARAAIAKATGEK